jgi:hypothetical protein
LEAVNKIGLIILNKIKEDKKFQTFSRTSNSKKAAIPRV